MIKIDPYFKPILISSSVILALNTLFLLPFISPLFTYFAGGFLASYLFKAEMKDIYYEIKMKDIFFLGGATGVVSGSIITLIIAVKLQNEDLKMLILEMINKQLQMNSNAEYPLLTQLEPSFYVITAIVTLFIAVLICFFGSLSAIPFLNKGKK
jgi:hypothetical protein